MKDVSTKVNLFAVRCSYLEKFLKMPGTYGSLLNVYFWLILIFNFLTKTNNCDALRDLVAFAQFKKREKHPWRSVDFSKVAGFSLQLY